jgi:hypothetical protein
MAAVCYLFLLVHWFLGIQFLDATGIERRIRLVSVSRRFRYYHSHGYCAHCPGPRWQKLIPDR